MAKRIVTIDLYQAADGDHYRGSEVDLDGDELKRAEDNRWVAAASSDEAKQAVATAHEVPANRAAASTPAGEAANTKASRDDAPGLRGDQLRREGKAPAPASPEERTNKT